MTIREENITKFVLGDWGGETSTVRIIGITKQRKVAEKGSAPRLYRTGPHLCR